MRATLVLLSLCLLPTLHAQAPEGTILIEPLFDEPTSVVPGSIVLLAVGVENRGNTTIDAFVSVGARAPPANGTFDGNARPDGNATSGPQGGPPPNGMRGSASGSFPNGSRGPPGGPNGTRPGGGFPRGAGPGFPAAGRGPGVLAVTLDRNPNLTLAPGEYVELTLRVSAPAGAPPGDERVPVAIRRPDGAVLAMRALAVRIVEAPTAAGEENEAPRATPLPPLTIAAALALAAASRRGR